MSITNTDIQDFVDLYDYDLDVSFGSCLAENVICVGNNVYPSIISFSHIANTDLKVLVSSDYVIEKKYLNNDDFYGFLLQYLVLYFSDYKKTIKKINKPVQLSLFDFDNF